MSEKFAVCFTPLRSERAALSPDGTRVAYTVRRGNSVHLVVAPAENPTAVQHSSVIGDDRAATGGATGQREDSLLSVSYLAWFDDARLVLSTNAVNQNQGVEILAIDADGKNARVLVTASDVAEQVIPGETPFTNGRGVVPRPRLRTKTGNLFGAVPTPDMPRTGPSSGGVQDSFSAAEETVSRPRVPTIVDLQPGPRDTILIRAGIGARYSLYRVNIRTGAQSRPEDFETDLMLVPLLDRGGHPRVGVPWSPNRPYPWPLEFDLGGKPAAGGKGLAARFPAELAAHLAITADNFHGERVVPLGFDFDPNVLFFASNVGRDAYGVYSLDLAAGQVRPRALEREGVDLVRLTAEGFAGGGALITDRHLRRVVGVRYSGLRSSGEWMDPDLADLQEQLEDVLPGENVNLLEWDAERRNVLVRHGSVVHAGAFGVFDRSAGKLREFAPNDTASTAGHRAFGFSLPHPAGGTLTGRLVMPVRSRLRPVPVVLRCRPDPLEPISANYDSQVVAFAQMGLAVLEVDARGVFGRGLRHRAAFRQGYESAQIDDLLAALEAAARKFAINPSRVVIAGERYGGFVALRALRLHPDRFRGALALDAWIEPREELNPPIDSMPWSFVDAARMRTYLGGEARLAEVSLLADAEPFRRPVLITADPGPLFLRSQGEVAPDRYRAARRLADRETKGGATIEFVDLEPEAVAGLPRAQTRLYGRYEEFLNLALYDFGVNFGPMQEVPMPEGER